MINQFVVTLFKKTWNIYDSDQTGFSYVNEHMQKHSRFYMPIKTFVKNSTYGLLYKCVSKALYYKLEFDLIDITS